MCISHTHITVTPTVANRWSHSRQWERISFCTVVSPTQSSQRQGAWHVAEGGSPYSYCKFSVQTPSLAQTCPEWFQNSLLCPSKVSKVWGKKRKAERLQMVQIKPGCLVKHTYIRTYQTSSGNAVQFPQWGSFQRFGPCESAAEPEWETLQLITQKQEDTFILAWSICESYSWFGLVQNLPASTENLSTQKVLKLYKWRNMAHYLVTWAFDFSRWGLPVDVGSHRSQCQSLPSYVPGCHKVSSSE